MSYRQRIRLVVELLVAGSLLAFGSLAVRYAHGQVVGDKSHAACLKNKQYFENAWKDGRIPTVPLGRCYVDEPLDTPIKVGCGRLATKGTGGYWIPFDHPTHSGKTSGIVQLTPGLPVLRLRGSGFVSEDPLYLEREGPGPLIEVEGRSKVVATGHHRLRNLIFYNATDCIVALNGYYERGQFVRDENHADNSIVENWIAFHCDTIFKSVNEQSINWVFREGFWQGLRPGTTVGRPFNIERGGVLTVDGFTPENARFNLVRVRDFSPNTCRLLFRNLRLDSMSTPDTNFCWFEYAGPEQAKPWSKWDFELDGFAATQQKHLEQHEQYKNCEGLPREMWRVDIKHVLQTDR